MNGATSCHDPPARQQYLRAVLALRRQLPGRGEAGRGSPGSVVLCSVVVAELLFGALRSRDTARNLAEVQKFISGFVSLPFDDRAASEYARIRADLTARGMVIGPNDLMIAAIAVPNGLTLVTHHTAEFSRVTGLRLEDWQTP